MASTTTVHWEFEIGETVYLKEDDSPPLTIVDRYYLEDKEGSQILFGCRYPHRDVRYDAQKDLTKAKP